MDNKEIDSLIQSLKETGNAIKRADRLITGIKSEELKKYYNVNLLQMIDYYKFLSECLKDDLKKHFDEEQSAKAPINLLYRRVYKSIIL
jgi:hypothetical protein